MRVAIVHDWLYVMRGGEKVLEVFCELYPQADLYCLFHVPGSVSQTIEQMKIHTSFINRLPLARKHHRWFLPLFPTAIERFNLANYDLILSSSHCAAKGVIPPPESCHISYVLTPMRYVWDLYDDYFGRAGFFSRKLIPFFANYLRTWDVSSSARVDSFVAISTYVAKRIKKFYRRDAVVIHPPVDTDKFNPSGKPPEDFYLAVSGLVPYKRVNLAVEAFNELGLPLRIIGTGPEEKRLRKSAKKNVRLLGWQPDSVIAQHYANCKALVFPGKEDFGIVPVEAMASGRPVIAYGRGGVEDTVVALRERAPDETTGMPTGVFFDEQSAASLCEAVRFFEKDSERFDPAAIRKHALKFDRVTFKKNIADFIEREFCQFRTSS